MPNRLHAATSPYLLQHQDNPVDWYEWGDEAFAEAKRRDVLLILSVGYSACHWCHVMAHESFEDDATARYMNDHFVNIKVDREERPDVDRVYMDAVTAMTGRGGWPMTVFLTPDAKPVFAGTYFPKVAMAHHPSFMDVMAAVVDAWDTNRTGALDQAEHIASAVQEQAPSATDLPGIRDLERAVATLSGMFDRVNGGFGQAPKFPHAPTLEFLARMAVLRAGTEAGKSSTRMLTQSLTAMASGGIYDHLLGGFARYSVDARWLIPHFEKMLYDNALLARIYLRSWQFTRVDQFETVARQVLDYLDTVMADERGALHSAEDADSEGEEGRFAVWSWDELGEVLNTDRNLAAAIYGATPEGNFEGKNNLHRFTDLENVASSFGVTVADVVDAKQRIDNSLRSARSRRTRPGRDDKIVSAWNGFALRAFAEAAAILEDDRYLARAVSIAEFLLSEASQGGGLVRSWRGRPGHRAFADDLASTAIGLYTLMSVTGEDRWFIEAESMVSTLRDRFADDEGGFFATATDDLITRPKNSQDNPTPSDNSLALEALQIHIALTGDLAATEQFNNTMRFLNHGAVAHPAFGGHALAVWLTHLIGIKEVAVVGTPAQQETLVRPVWAEFRPDVVLALGDGGPSSVPLLADRGSGDSGLAFVCQNLVCDLPVSRPEDLADKLDASDAQATR